MQTPLRKMRVEKKLTIAEVALAVQCDESTSEKSVYKCGFFQLCKWLIMTKTILHRKHRLTFN